jgi:ornithine cyclodeaminase
MRFEVEDLEGSSDRGSESLPQPLFISDNVVAEILTTDLAYRAVSQGLKCHASGDFLQPLKPYVRPKGREGERDGGRYIAMPGFVGGAVQAVGVKWIASVPRNIDLGLPRASGVVVLNDVTTGRPVAILQCETLSARRTAAVAAISVNHLAPAGPKRVAIIGAGPIASEVVRALSERCTGIEEFRIHDLRLDRAERLASQTGQGACPAARVCLTAELCVRGANVVIPATTGAKEYIPLSWFAAPWLVVALSLEDCRPEVLLSADKVVVDDYDQCAREEKLLDRLMQQGLFSRANVYAELGEIVSGDKVGREGSECIYVNPMGMAIEDLSVAAEVYRLIRSRTTESSN